MASWRPVFELTRCNIRGFFREPEAIFWAYGFPLLMVVALGIAFDTSGEGRVQVDVIESDNGSALAQALEDDFRFQVWRGNLAEAMQRLKLNKTLLVVRFGSGSGVEYFFDPDNPESRNARAAVDTALQKAAGRTDLLAVQDRKVTAPGSRYVDFLVPGLIGLNLMGGGLWGVGFVLVDMRIKKLLKRMLATPMRRTHFLLSVMGTRVFFFIPEAMGLLVTAHWIFGVPIAGSIQSILVVALIGALAFAGLGLLAGSRAERIETISGILNVVMMPMWLCSGVFFSSERFPQVMQPFIQALPLTQLINVLRAVILEGQSVTSQLLPLLFLILWGILSFFLALKWFRWT